MPIRRGLGLAAVLSGAEMAKLPQQEKTEAGRALGVFKSDRGQAVLGASIRALARVGVKENALNRQACPLTRYPPKLLLVLLAGRRSNALCLLSLAHIFHDGTEYHEARRVSGYICLPLSWTALRERGAATLVPL